MHYLAWKGMIATSSCLVSPVTMAGWHRKKVGPYGRRYSLRARKGDLSGGRGIFASTHQEAFGYSSNVYLVAPAPGAKIIPGLRGWRAERAFVADGPFSGQAGAERTDAKPIQDGYMAILQAALSGYRFIPGVLLEAASAIYWRYEHSWDMVRDALSLLEPHLEEVLEYAPYRETISPMWAKLLAPRKFIELAYLSRKQRNIRLTLLAALAWLNREKDADLIGECLRIVLPAPADMVAAAEDANYRLSFATTLCKLLDMEYAHDPFDELAEAMVRMYPIEGIMGLQSRSELHLICKVRAIRFAMRDGAVDREAALRMAVEIARDDNLSFLPAMRTSIASILAEVGTPEDILAFARSNSASRRWIALETSRLLYNARPELATHIWREAERKAAGISA